VTTKPDITPEALPKKERATEVVLFVILVMVLVPSAFCWVFFFGRFYGAVGIVSFVLLAGFSRRFLRRKNLSETEIMRRIDKAMGKPSDDPRQMARWLR
jgi:hypothetical protein